MLRLACLQRGGNVRRVGISGLECHLAETVKRNVFCGVERRNRSTRPQSTRSLDENPQVSRSGFELALETFILGVLKLAKPG